VNEALLALVVLVNLSSWPLSQWIGTAQGWHYVLQGVQGFVLWSLISHLLPVALIACMAGATLSGMIVACGLQIVANPIAAWPYGGVCSITTGLPMTIFTVMGLAVCLLLSVTTKQRRIA
jgi:hypothetical protein